MPELLLDWTPNVQMTVQELLGVVCSQCGVLRLELAENGVPHHFRQHAWKHVCEVLATESALDDTHSHVVLDSPIVVGSPPCSHIGVMSLHLSGNKFIGHGEVSQRVRRKVTCPSLNILGDLLVLQVCHDLLLPFEEIVLSKPRKASWGVGQGGTGIGEMRDSGGEFNKARWPRKGKKEKQAGTWLTMMG